MQLPHMYTLKIVLLLQLLMERPPTSTRRANDLTSLISESLAVWHMCWCIGISGKRFSPIPRNVSLLDIRKGSRHGASGTQLKGSSSSLAMLCSMKDASLATLQLPSTLWALLHFPDQPLHRHKW